MKATRRGERVVATIEQPGREITFDFEGRPLTAREGDSVAAALMASGLRIFGRSSKYHRPRGYRCGHGHCSSCAMRVDGVPGVRTCVTAVRPGMVVEREHAWPSADHDVQRAAEVLSPLMPPGFYYRWFRHSPSLFGIFERGLAHVAGQGAMASAEAAVRLGAARCERREHVDVLVVGGGLAGMSAALAAAGGGAQVLLVEAHDQLGGRLADDLRHFPEVAAIAGSDQLTGPAIAGCLAADVSQHSGIEVLIDAEAIGWYAEDTIAVDRHPDLLLVNPSAVVLATGGYDLGLPFPNCDLPGVVLASGGQRLLNRYGVRPGSKAVFLTLDDFGYAVARQFVAAGIRVACVADRRPIGQADEQLVRSLASKGVPILAGIERPKAKGLSRVRGLSLRVGGARRRFDCDVVCVSAGCRPADDLARQASYDGSIVLSATASVENGPASPRRLWLAGLVTGADSPAAAIAQGKAAGKAVRGSASG